VRGRLIRASKLKDLRTEAGVSATWTYEIRLDGYRLEAVHSAGETTLSSRRKNVLNKKFGVNAEALNQLPNGTVSGGELVAIDIRATIQNDVSSTLSALRDKLMAKAVKCQAARKY
jgi:ATP-dependent DNA ligase